MNKLKSKRKKAEWVVIPQQPLQDLNDRAATLTTHRKTSSEAAELQLKMKKAAKEFAKLMHGSLDSILEEEYLRKPLGFFILRELLPYVCCTPKAVLFPLESEWIRLTEENVVAACRWLRLTQKNAKVSFFISSDEDVKSWFKELRKAAKKYGKVSWVLPKLQEGGALV
jgi:hypothetical protein